MNFTKNKFCVTGKFNRFTLSEYSESNVLETKKPVIAYHRLFYNFKNLNFFITN